MTRDKLIKEIKEQKLTLDKLQSNVDPPDTITLREIADAADRQLGPQDLRLFFESKGIKPVGRSVKVRRGRPYLYNVEEVAKALGIVLS